MVHCLDAMRKASTAAHRTTSAWLTNGLMHPRASLAGRAPSVQGVGVGAGVRGCKAAE